MSLPDPDEHEQEMEIRHLYGPQVSLSIKMLSVISRNLQHLATANFLLIVGLILLLATAFYWVVGSHTLLNVLALPLFSSLIFVANLIGLLVYERLRRRGDAIFAELSDELQWRLVNEGYASHDTQGMPLPPPPGFKYSEPNQRDRPSLTIRIVLRTFIRNTDLPFIRGANGPLIYFLLSIALWATSMLLSLKSTL